MMRLMAPGSRRNTPTMMMAPANWRADSGLLGVRVHGTLLSDVVINKFGSIMIWSIEITKPVD